MGFGHWFNDLFDEIVKSYTSNCILRGTYKLFGFDTVPSSPSSALFF